MGIRGERGRHFGESFRRALGDQVCLGGAGVSVGGVPRAGAEREAGGARRR